MNISDKLLCNVLCNLFVVVALIFAIPNRVVASGSDASSKVDYRYDELGRIRSAAYVDGSVFEYNYDDNGNIISIIINRNNDKTETDKERPDREPTSTDGENQDKTTEKVTEKVTEAASEGTTEKVTEAASEGTTEKVTEAASEGTTEKLTEDVHEPTTERKTVKSSEKKVGNEPEQISELMENTTEERETEAVDNHKANDIIEHNIELSLEKEPEVDIDNISQLNFKKKRPVIKSFKLTKKKGKRYLHIQMKRLVKQGKYRERGYQIRYSDNSKFKKSKAFFVNRNSRKKITVKKWKVKNSKTYYVKVRAYIITKSRKKIYSRYSRVKKIVLE